MFSQYKNVNTYTACKLFLLIQMEKQISLKTVHVPFHAFYIPSLKRNFSHMCCKCGVAGCCVCSCEPYNYFVHESLVADIALESVLPLMSLHVLLVSRNWFKSCWFNLIDLNRGCSNTQERWFVQIQAFGSSRLFSCFDSLKPKRNSD